MNQTEPLLLDAIARLRVNPTSVHCWHRVEVLLRALPAAACGEALARLPSFAPDGGVIPFLKETLLVNVDGVAHLPDAARRLLEIAPVDPDRICAFLLFAWARLIAANCAHADYIDGFASACFPALSRRAAGLIAPMPAMPRRAIQRVRKVALVASQLSTISHTPTRMALDQLAVLRELGYEVQVFSAQEQSPPDMPTYLGADCDAPHTQPDTAGWLRYLRADAQFSFVLGVADTRFSMRERWCGILSQIAAFDPDLVFFVGLYGPMLFPLYESRPVLALCTHAFAPIAPVDAWLCADPVLAGRSAPAWGDALPAAHACFHPYRIRHPRAPRTATRAELGLPADKLILISVGARLPEEITGQWAAAMLRTLAACPQLCWVLVGGTGATPAALAAANDGVLMVLPHRDDVPALLALSDVYLNPPRIGGGFSVAEAMAEALPVVALRGADGGNKIGDQAVATDDAYFAYLADLIASEALRRSAGAALRELFERTLSLDHSQPSLAAAIATTLAAYRQRAAS